MSQVQGSRFSRRELVGGAAATAAGMALPEAADARRRRRRRRTRSADVAIVGAGLAGLVAARDLTRAGKDVIVLEARNRVGGRMYSKSLGPGATDVANMGATFIGPTQRRILALARELGVGIFDTYNTGKNVSYFGGSRGTYSGAVPLINPAALAEAQLAIVQFDDMAKEVPLDAPWRAERAEEWDGKLRARLSRRGASARRIALVRPGDPRVGGRHPLGRSRDGHGVARLHGRCRAVGGAGGEGGPGGAVRDDLRT